jgi:Peroxin-3
MTRLRISMTEVADVSSLWRTLKDIRQTPPSDSHSVEVQLWEEIKVVAFSNLFVASYMLCAMCVIVQFQLHIVAARNHTRMKLVSSSNDTNTSSQSQTDQIPLSDLSHADMFSSSSSSIDLSSALIHQTFNHFFETGGLQLSNVIKTQVANDLIGWNVQQKQRVEFKELIQMINQIRHHLESDVSKILHILFPSK